MRVISGSARGNKLFAPQGLMTRPTSDRIKETLFNIIASDLQDCYFLDLFSGTGAIGIEALSRGARKTVFVDNGSESIDCIKKNLIKTKFTNKAEILQTDASEAVKRLGLRKEKFDIIFLDPPYSDKLFELDIIAKAEILEDKGYVIIELSDTAVNTQYLKIDRIKEFNKTKLVFLSLKQSA